MKTHRPVHDRRVYVFPRRHLLGATGSLAAMSVTGCFKTPEEKIVPYVRRPAGLTPGVPLHFATAHSLHGYAVGLVVESYNGHPTKVEGNPRHPSSLGAAGVFEQALPNTLYDTERAGAFLHEGKPVGRLEFTKALAALAGRLATERGRGLRLLLEPTSSPFERMLLERIRVRYPEAKFVSYESLSRANLLEGARLAYGLPFETEIAFSRAKVVLALDSNFLAVGPSSLRDARELMVGRNPDGVMSRLYVVESAWTETGIFADHRLRVAPSRVLHVAIEMLDRILTIRGRERSRLPVGFGSATERERTWADAVARDLARAGAQAVVVAGSRQPPLVHAIAHAINELTGSAQELVTFRPPGLFDIDRGPNGVRELADHMNQGAVDTLVITAHNPAVTVPADVGFTSALSRVSTVVYTSLRHDDTSIRAPWYVPALHLFETWGDARAIDGTASIVQPLLAPLFGGFSHAQILALLAGEDSIRPYDGLKAFWSKQRPSPRFDQDWEQWLAAGVIPDTAFAPVPAVFDWTALTDALHRARPAEPEGLEIGFGESSTVFDGRFIGNSWLLELPSPTTKVTWENPALVSSGTAKQWGLETGDLVDLQYRGQQLRVPVFVAPGHADRVVSLLLGWGRGLPGAEAPGFATSGLRHSDALWFDGGLSLRKTGLRHTLAVTQVHQRDHGRDAAVARTAADWQRGRAHFLEDRRGPVRELYHDTSNGPYEWAMAIDLNRCTGCSACVVACQSENNIPVVGKEEVVRRREMHWLRVDLYHQSQPEAEDDERVVTQPLACVHCEKAPCEYVCPVAATVHSDEGLNEMVYNRCVGTRFCSNNCPYKVRRFNYKEYNPKAPGVFAMSRNPEVTIRPQGVMEKCTYCVQRIEKARIDARIAGRRIDTTRPLLRLQTACQQTCPTEAIVFGSLTEADSPVAQLHRSQRAYELLHELGTRPRTMHLARIRNPNPELDRGT